MRPSGSFGWRVDFQPCLNSGQSLPIGLEFAGQAVNFRLETVEPGVHSRVHRPHEQDQHRDEPGAQDSDERRDSSLPDLSSTRTGYGGRFFNSLPLPPFANERFAARSTARKFGETGEVAGVEHPDHGVDRLARAGDR